MYSRQDTEYIIQAYLVDKIPIADIAAKVGKPIKSVIAKLSSEDVYSPKLKISKVTGGTPKTKKEYVKDICDLLEMEYQIGLEKADKTALIQTADKIREKMEK